MEMPLLSRDSAKVIARTTWGATHPAIWIEWGRFDVKLYLLATALGSLLLSVGLIAQTQTQAPASGLTDNPVYKKDCAGCHGKTAEGRHFGGPSLVSDKVAGASADQLRDMITNGKGRMPQYASKLTSDKIDLLVQQIQSANNANKK
jgi:mono/diheme cytochrome c family protein